MSTSVNSYPYGIMRHAAYTDSGKGVTSNPASIHFLQENVLPELLKRIEGKNIAILCSTDLHAICTANAIIETLVGQNYTVTTSQEGLLRENSSACIDREFVDDVCDFHDIPAGTFTLFITHEPVIQRTLGRTINYCGIFSSDFEIKGHM